ncbi:hypothetical protein OHU11_39845 [Streptomyces sp. NBC_00257]|uniref:hypothetical protein n=1 Tax=unclassified Streptomyces TaxID=2593676 RepID=UPI002251DCC1|nr:MULTISPECIES: hypothetical protein [unclassified Streptomyces]WTB60849.1 hypothetical protein OG832_48485 [Streptomyces sp. NBC_00826]WTH95990.1 hypothetical protein OIC43_44015 [Streptomyces sp. NBC_00825]WTI04986.1 hypothetical protein OHA23_45630 [Streptomyces sp. NBC_00822]MCX4870366.1 hypothetical protein [Streptomyces sp. NBC_00906]MCX4902157.1 hypothetical protein [Streptomyces sp. NBC_00892]
MRPTRPSRPLLIAAVLVAGVLLLTACQDSDSVEPAGTTAASPSPGTSGTLGPGTVSYLAPGKYAINVSGTGQRFSVSDRTEVYGAGGICGEHTPEATDRCTLDELKEAGNGGVPAIVVVEKGVATRVTEVFTPRTSPPDVGHSTE